MAQLGFSQQVLIQDFETAASYTFAGFEGLASASVVADPAAGGTNGNCFKLINQTSGQPWQGAEVILTQKKIKLTTDKTIQISVYSTQAFNMLCKVEVGGPASANGQAYTTPGQWQTLTFNFNAPMDNTGVANGEYEKIVFFGNWKATNDGFDTPQNFAFHVDNITAEEATVTPVPVPTEAAPAPPERLEADVVSIFSDVYTNVTVNEWGPNWGPSSTPITDNPIAGNATKKISMGAGQTFAGISFVSSAFDATSFTHFHVDYWIAAPLPAGQVFNVKLSNHNGGSGETSAVQYTAIPSAGSQWLSLDIPLADFVAASNPANLDRNAIAQIIITGARADTNVPVSIYFDNMYFHKNTIVNPVLPLLLDFETAAEFTFAGFEGLASATVVADPASGGTNGNGFKLSNQTSGQPWQGAEVVLTTKKAKLTTNKTMTLEVYSTQAFNLLCKVEVGGPASANGQAYTTPGQWQTLTFDFNVPMDNTVVANGEYEKIVFFGNWKATNDGFNAPQNFDLHIDNIRSEIATSSVTGPTEATPTPPERPVTDVVSIFSDAYDNITVDEWGPNWGASSTPITDNPIAGNATKKISMGAGQAFAGISFVSSAFDATPFTHFHVDYWIASPINAGQVLDIKLSNHDGGSGETSAIQYTAVPTTGGQWASLDILLANFLPASNPANLARNAIAQIVLTASRADMNVPVNVYFDNMYFHKNTLLGTDSFESTKFKMYPNPAQDVLNIVSEEVIQNVSIYNLLGQNVMSVMNDSQNLILNVSNLQDGIYMVRTTTNGIETTQKFIKK